MIKSRGDLLRAFFVVLPSIAAVGIFIYGFIGWSLRASFSAWDGIIPDFTFVGFKNYLEVFSNVRFQKDLWNTLYFTFFFLLLSICWGLLLAWLLDRKVKGEALLRNIFLFPMSISFVVTGVVWRWIFNPTVGVNALLKLLGFSGANWGWYTDPTSVLKFHLALIPVILAASWQLTGYTMAMFLAGLRGIPEDLIDHARIDGASELYIFRRIILPLLKPITLSAMIVLGHFSLKIFDLIYTMTGKGPAFATDVPAIFMFETTFRGNHYAEGAVISIVMLLLVAVVIVPYLYSTFRKEIKR
ncbi:MAG: sugar ABC transporter permease [Spirochaetes bacterium]|nr:MAG: sugar ABC transporter permease [Spirochaetota bacterium]